MRRSGLVTLAALAVAFTAAPALAAGGSVHGRLALPLEVQGPHEARASDGAFVLQGPEGSASLLLQDAEGRLERVIHRSYGYVNAQDPKLELTWDDEVDREVLPLTGSLVSLSERRHEFQLLADEGPLSLASGPRGGGLLTGILDSPKTVDYLLDREISLRLQPPSEEDAFSETLPAGLYQDRALDGRVSLDGPFRLFVSDAVLGYHPAEGDAKDILAHFRVEERPGALYDPRTSSWTGPGTHTEYVQEYVLLHVARGHLEVQFADVAGYLYAPRQSIQVEGTAFLPSFTGTIAVTEDGKTARHQVTADDLELQGLFTLDLRAPDRAAGTTGVAGSGDFTYVAYGTVAETYDWTTVATAVGLGAVAVAVGAWLVAQAKTLLAPGAALVAGYARVHGPKILEHPGRAQVYEMVKANPGVSFMDLSRGLNLGESTLTYHVRVLERNGFVSTVKDGRYLRYYDRQSGTYSGERKLAVSALRNRTTAAIAQEIQRRPGVAQRDLAETFHIAPSTVNWHIRRLSEVGLVDQRRDHPHTRYFLGEAWASLPAEEQARFAAPAAVTA